jgi:hypothetical protein
MMLALKSAKWFDTNCEEGTIDFVEGKQSNEGEQHFSGGWHGPVTNQIEFRLDRAITIRGYVMSDVFDSVC